MWSLCLVLATILTGPYLQNAGTHGVSVCLETSAEEKGLKLRWGRTPEELEKAPRRVPFAFTRAPFSGTWLAVARVDGQPEGTRVCYEVGGRRGETTLWRDCRDDFTCAFFADFQSGLKWGDVSYWEEDPFLCGQRIFEDIVASGCEFAVTAGDLADTGDYEKEIKPLFLERTCGILGAKMPFFTAFGNHDTAYPANHFFVVNPTPSSFAFFKNGCLFVCIDDREVGDDKTPGSMRLRVWLEETLSSDAARQAKFRFVFQHVPVYVEHFGNCNRWLVDLFERYGVDCVFSGDHHGYERIFRGRTRQVTCGCLGWLERDKASTNAFANICNWYGDTVAGGHVPVRGRPTWRAQAPGRPGVLGEPISAEGGILPGYSILEVKGDTATWTMIGFNADGSKIGPIDSFTMKSGVRPDKPKAMALERYVYATAKSGVGLLKYTLTGKGGRTVVVCSSEKFPKSEPLLGEDFVGVRFTAADGRTRTVRLLADNTLFDDGKGDCE